MKSEGARKASPDQIALLPPHGSARELTIGHQFLCALKTEEQAFSLRMGAKT